MGKNRTASIFIRISAAVLILAILIPVSVFGDDMRQYNEQFTDVPTDAWYHDSVARAYSAGLINGKTADTFVPNGDVTIAEVIKLAAVSHKYITSGSVSDEYFKSTYPGTTLWYEPYLRYALENSIVTETYENYNAPATRATVSVLFHRVIQTSGTTPAIVNNITGLVLNDVPTGTWYYTAIYRLYAWGIMNGDGTGNMYPESKVKRSEIAAIVIRVTNPDDRAFDENIKEEDPEKPKEGSYQIVLHQGTNYPKTFTGISSVGAEFYGKNGEYAPEYSHELDNLSNLTISESSFSFDLYYGSGFDALTIIRGWLNESATVINNQQKNEIHEVKSKVNEYLRLWVDGTLVSIRQLWITDTTNYTNYTFFFEDNIDPRVCSEIYFALGKMKSEDARSFGLESLAQKISLADKDTSENTDEPAQSGEPTEKYYEEIEKAKSNAVLMIFEYECERGTILYGVGLYGGNSTDYRLIIIFKNGETLTVARDRVEKVRVNDSGDVLYYSIIAPDGYELAYGINLKY